MILFPKFLNLKQSAMRTINLSGMQLTHESAFEVHLPELYSLRRRIARESRLFPPTFVTFNAFARIRAGIRGGKKEFEIYRLSAPARMLQHAFYCIAENHFIVSSMVSTYAITKYSQIIIIYSFPV